MEEKFTPYEWAVVQVAAAIVGGPSFLASLEARNGEQGLFDTLVRESVELARKVVDEVERTSAD